MADTPALLRRWRKGHAAAARVQRELRRREGPKPQESIAMFLSSLDTLAEMGLWPGPRDAASEREIAKTRRMWARLQKHARRGQAG